MPLTLVAMLLAPLLLAPLSTARLIGEALTEERRQIAFDNAAIVLGRHVRLALRALAMAETGLAAADFVHHPVHLCAAVKPPCRAADMGLERGIELLFRNAEAVFRAALAAAPMRARAELVSEKALAQVDGPSLRLSAVRCPICRLPVRWEVQLGEGSVTELSLRRRRRVVRWSGEGAAWDQWNYRVVWNEVAAASFSK